MTCEPHKYGGYPQTRYTGTGTGHLPHIRPQAVPAWKMFCRELLLPAGSQLDAADAFLLGYRYRHDIAGGELVEDFRSGLDPVHIDLGLSTGNQLDDIRTGLYLEVCRAFLRHHGNDADIGGIRSGLALRGNSDNLDIHLTERLVGVFGIRGVL